MFGVSLIERLDATGQAIRDQQQAASRLALTLAELAEETDLMVAELRASGLAMPVLKEGPSPVLKEKPSHMDVDLHHDHQPGRDNSKTPQTPGSGHEQRIKGLADASERVKTPRMFADPEEMVDKTRENLTKEVGDATKLYKQMGIFQAMAKNPCFEMSSVVLVIFSCIWMAVEIDFNDKTSLHESDTIFQVVAHLTCLLFLLEIMVRILAFRRLRDVMKDSWVVFDLVLVLFFVIETWIIGTIAAVTDMTMSGGGMKLVIMLRVLRLMRIMRFARVLRVAPELMVIVRGIGRALRAILAVLALILIIIFVAAILFTVLMDGSTLGQEYFRSVPTSMGTLMLEFTLSGSRGTALTRAAWAVHPILALLLVLFVCVANITMLGVLTGLLVQTVKTVAEVEKEEKTTEHVVGAMEDLWKAFDCDSDGTVDQKEFDSMISFRDTARVLRTLGIDAEGLACISDFVFAENRGRLSRSAFLRMVLDSRSTNKATLKDHIETRKFVEARLFRLFQRGWADGSRKAMFLGQGENHSTERTSTWRQLL